ncbi:MAG: GDSL-type esterase/lipase family protein, partial [Oscillospiraceae bacterium]
MNKKNTIITIIICAILLSATVAMYFISKPKFVDYAQPNNKDIQNDNAIPNDDETDNQPISNEIPEENNEEITEDNYIVGENEKVDINYFDDAVFIGNSRTQGLMLYGGLNNAKFYADKGLMVNKVDEKPITIMGQDNKETVVSALRKNGFGKYYIMLGTNELGWAYENIFIENYQKLIDILKEVNPNGIIYIQSILPVSKEKSDSNKVYNNIKIESYNTLLKKLAEDNKIYYVDVAQQFKDEEGNLIVDASSDGVHLKAEYCKQWTEYLQTHTAISDN